MKSKTKSIAQLAAELAEDPKVEKQVNDEVARNKMVSSLLNMRVNNGFSQDDLSSAIGCSASKISRLESGNDENLKWFDIVNYASAVNRDVFVTFEDRSSPLTARIKTCVFQISDYLGELTLLAKEVGGNDDIAKKIHEFSGEVLLNFLIKYQDHSAELRSVVKVSPNIKTPELRYPAFKESEEEHSEDSATCHT